MKPTASKSRFLVVVCASSLCSCATIRSQVSSAHANPLRSGDVQSTAVQAPKNERYEAVLGTRFEQPVPFPENPVPVYPADLLSQRLSPIEVHVRLVVDKHGVVSESRLTTPTGGQTSAFSAAVISATLQWHFLPLVEIKAGPGTSSIFVGDTEFQYAGEATALPFHQDYAFVFSQVDGSPSVGTQDAPSATEENP